MSDASKFYNYKVVASANTVDQPINLKEKYRYFPMLVKDVFLLLEWSKKKNGIHLPNQVYEQIELLNRSSYKSISENDSSESKNGHFRVQLYQGFLKPKAEIDKLYNKPLTAFQRLAKNVKKKTLQGGETSIVEDNASVLSTESSLTNILKNLDTLQGGSDEYFMTLDVQELKNLFPAVIQETQPTVETTDMKLENLIEPTVIIEN